MNNSIKKELKHRIEIVVEELNSKLDSIENFKRDIKNNPAEYNENPIYHIQYTLNEHSETIKHTVAEMKDMINLIEE